MSEKKKYNPPSIKGTLGVLFADLILIFILLVVSLGIWHRVFFWFYIPTGILTLVVFLVFSLYLVDRNTRPCPECGSKLDNKAGFCMQCGAKVPLFCPSCKNKIKGTPKYCPVCGYDLGKKGTEEEVKKEPKGDVVARPGYCGVCGGKVSEKAKYCPLCGSEIT